MRSLNLAFMLLAGLGGVLHVLFFVLESILFSHPEVQRRFLLEGANTVAAMRVLMLNQGFYNLFLALGAFGGLVLLRRCETSGRALVLYTCAFMVGAGVVLAISEPDLIGAACVQGVPPALALACFAASRRAAAEPVRD